MECGAFLNLGVFLRLASKEWRFCFLQMSVSSLVLCAYEMSGF